MDMGFFLQKERIFQASIKLAQPFPAPELRTENFMDMRIFLILNGEQQRIEGLGAVDTHKPRNGFLSIF